MVHLKPRPLASLPTAKISTGCPQLDQALGGGLACGSLTEVTGEAAASKTQLCLQLLLSAQLPRGHGGLEGSAVYVYTEGSPAMQRLRQLASCLRFRYPPEALATIPDPAANIFVEKGVQSGSELLARLQRLRGLLDRQRSLARAAASGAAGGSASGLACGRPVRLLVVDSVAHVFRDLGDRRPGSSGAGLGELTGRTELLFKISALLRRYADEYGLAVLLVNQVVDSVDSSAVAGGPGSAAIPLQQQQAGGRAPAAKNTGHTGGMRLASMGREVVPALGLAWANCISTRIFLSRCPAPDGSGPALFHGTPSPAAAAAAAAGEGGGGGALAPALRRMQVVFAPHLPRGSECHYVVEASGVRGLHPDELEQHHVAAAAAAAQHQQLAWEEEQRQRRAWEQQQQTAQQQGQQQGQQQDPGLDGLDHQRSVQQEPVWQGQHQTPAPGRPIHAQHAAPGQTGWWHAPTAPAAQHEQGLNWNAMHVRHPQQPGQQQHGWQPGHLPQIACQAHGSWQEQQQQQRWPLQQQQQHQQQQAW